MGILCLDRDEGEKVVVGDETELTVLKVVGKKVTLGFRAPPHIVIYRSEISDEKKAGIQQKQREFKPR
jgi:carbon storage regulator